MASVPVSPEKTANVKDVEYDFDVSASLQTAFRNAASALDGQRGSRAGYRSQGLTDFAGHFSQVFSSNGDQQLEDLDEIARNLRLVASKVAEVDEAAREENRRRALAREWAQRMLNRSDWDKFWDGVFGEEDPPVTSLEDSGPAKRVPAAQPKQPQTPAPGSGGGGSGGTSSARPANLRSFASSTRNADTELASRPGTLTNECSSFTSHCSWATLDASSVINAFSSWLSANDQDAQWADVVAGAFEQAGGDGVLTLPDAAVEAALQSAGVATSRTDIQVDPPVAHGSPPTTGYVNDPVNTATGNFLENEMDLGFGGASASLAWTRLYNSMNPESGAFGPGWSSWAECGMTFSDDGARFRLPDGRVVVFPREGAGWGRAVGENLWLERSPEGLRVSTNTGLVFELSEAGVVLAVDGGPGTRVRLERSAGRLTGMVHAFGRAVSLEWAGERIVAVAASDGRRVTYRYDEAGRLVAAEGPAGTRSYRWNPEGLIDRVTDADGVHEATNTYDELGRVVTQVSQHGRTTRFSYLNNRVTVVADEDGGRANTWIHDARGRLVGVIDADGRRQSMSYDRHGNQVSTTERDGQVSVAAFDQRGRRTTQLLPSGARIETRYDDADRVLEVSLEGDGRAATTRYDYHGDERNPSTLTDAEGGVTRFEWDANLLLAVTDPAGVRVAYTYDQHGDLIATTSADGHTARLERDAAGRVVAAVSPAGHRTSYAWDERGLLAGRTDPDGGLWRFEHSAGGRLTAMVDPYGARTEVALDEAGEAAATTDPLGRTIHRAFDDLGNLAGVTLPDGSRWEYAHDHLSRLIAATDPDGNTWHRDYDVNGQLAAVVDPSGRKRTATDVGSGLVTDKLGRIVATVAPDGSSHETRYDLCGRPVSFVDASGQVTSLERDAAGRVVTLRRPGDVVTRYEYDACGRLAAVTDPLGHTTKFEYSPDGHLATQTDPTGAETKLSYDWAGRLVERLAPGLGRTTWTYDLAGRLVRTRDPLWGTRSFQWDAAGQLVAAINPLGGVTRYDYDDLGRMVTITDPTGAVTRRSYNGRNKVVRSVDPLGRVTEGGYDGAGRPTWQLQPTGERLEWGYDEAGRLANQGVDGRVLAQFTHDLTTGTLTVVDSSDPGRKVEHTLRRDAEGRIVERTRDGRATRWTYDELGRCAAITSPSGAQTRYGHDAAGRITEVSSDEVGTVRLSRDAAGRILGAQAGSLTQEWAWAEGHVVAHRVSGVGEAAETTVVRDADGRITSITRDGISTDYSYDAAGQLVAAAGPNGTHTWTWDDAGRLLAESDEVGTTTYTYDAAGQLLARRVGDTETSYAYDANGRRILADGPRGRLEFSWGAFGWLEQVASAAGVTSVHVDALGELARVNDAELFWDTAVAQARPLEVAGAAVLSVGGFTATADGWALDGWRTARPTGTDPWAGAGGSVTGLMVNAGGRVSVADLDWLGARAYDPLTRGFLSVDPLPPVTGTAWGANPYSYAGNDPLHALDPSGLRPVTDAELQAYRDSNNGALAAAGDWLKDNWEYVAGGALFVAGGVLMATGVGGPAGMALIGMGADTIIQKATTGSVDWRQVAIGGAFSMVPGGGLVKGALLAGAEGAVTSGYSYMTSPGPHTAAGFLQATTTDAAMGVVTGGLLPPRANNVPTSRLDDMAPTPAELVDPNKIRFSQSSVNGVIPIEQSMRANGWVGEPIDVVRMSDGGLTSVDNTRVLASRRAEIDAQAVIHDASEALPSQEMIDRFTTKRGGIPSTWGEAVENRIGNQNAAYRAANPYGSDLVGWDGQS